MLYVFGTTKCAVKVARWVTSFFAATTLPQEDLELHSAVSFNNREPRTFAMGGRRARAKVAPAPAVLPHTTQPSQTAQPSPSNWIRAAFATTIIAIAILFAGWFSEHVSPTNAFRCLNHVNQWRHQCGFLWAVEIGVAECMQSNNIPLVSVVLQYGTTLPNVYPLYESQTAQHSLMVETAKRPGVHAFYAEAGRARQQ